MGADTESVKVGEREDRECINGAGICAHLLAGVSESSFRFKSSFLPVCSAGDMMRARAGLALVALQSCLAVMPNSTTGNNRDERLLWSGVACSANCETIVGVVGGYRGAAGRIYVSNDAGGSWTAGTVVRSWRAVALSEDSGTMVAVEDSSDERKGGFIYTSNDGGTTWSTRYGAGCRHWISVSSSADGSRVFAVVGGYTGDFM